MEEKMRVYELDEKDLDEIIGGEDLPYIGQRFCGKCGNDTATKTGFVIRNANGSLLKVHFSKPYCDFCAQQEIDLYLARGWQLVTWLK